MSVNYLVEINSLDDWELTHHLSDTAYKLMRKLQYLANKERFPRAISVSNSVLMGMVGCSKDSLIRARNQLMQAGLIRYKGQKRMRPLYEIQYFSNRREFAKSNSAPYPATDTATVAAPYPANTYINKTAENREEESTAATERDAHGRARVYSAGDERMMCSIQAFLRHLKTTQYARLFENAEAMRQMLETDRFPLGLVGEALEMALERHRRYPLFDGANYALQLLTDWSSRGITTPQQLQESRDNYSDC